jgi:hypothetical protein
LNLWQKAAFTTYLWAVHDQVPMKRPRGNLPEFSRPPLSEVVLSIQFASLTELKGIHLGLFWKGFRKQYPDVSEQPPIQTVFETFGVPQTPHAIQLQAFMSPPMPRYWFEKKGEPDLLQIQHDRLVHNWRGGEPRPCPSLIWRVL